MLYCGVSMTTAQQPWLNPLKICSSADGITFYTPVLFQDSSGVPTVIRLGGDTLVCAFQWFPMPMYNPHWDKVAVKFSYDNGISWTSPMTCIFMGLPGNFQRPFDPALVRTDQGRIRMYFSDGPIPGTVFTYSAISDDGIAYLFEPFPRFTDPSGFVIDPSVALFNSTYYYLSHSSVPINGFFRAVSADGLNFTPQPVFPFDGIHNWLGNYMLDETNLKFYGSAGYIWFNTSSDGVTWSGYTNTNITGGADPAAVKTNAGNYVMIFTALLPPSNIETNYDLKENISVYPNPASGKIIISGTNMNKVEIYNCLGEQVFSSHLMKQDPFEIDITSFQTGIYFVRIFYKEKIHTERILILR